MKFDKSEEIRKMAEKHGTEYENAVAEPTYLPSKYAHKGYTDTFYDEKEETGAGSFLLGAVVGGVIGAAAALFLAPKTGKEMRDDLSTQANQIKDKSIELSAIAKDKATEYGAIAKDKATDFTSTAKEKTEEVTKTIQLQSEQIADKVKSLKNNVNLPTDDGTVSSEGEEVVEFIEKVEEQIQNKVEAAEEKVTATAEALKEAVIEKTEDKK